MDERLNQHLPKLAELAREVDGLDGNGDEAKLREKAVRLAWSVLVLVEILAVKQRRGSP